MAYTKIVFQNSPSTATPLNAENLNHMDDQIALNDQRLTEIGTSYVKSFKGRKGEVVPENGDYNIGQIAPLTGAQVGQVPVVTNIGTEEAPELVFRMGAGGGAGGHEIIDSEGNTMPQESAMQFADSHVSDDSTNGRTVVENVKEVTLAELEQATERGMYLATDEESVPIGEIEKDAVSVTASSDTYKTALHKLRNDTDFDKITEVSILIIGNNVYSVTSMSSNEIDFSNVLGSVGSIGSKIRTIFFRKSDAGDCSFQMCTLTNSISRTNNENDALSDGTLIALYYGTSSGIVELNTEVSYSTAERKIGKWIDGSDLYEKTIDCGNLPNTSTSSTQIGVANIKNVVGIEGIAISSSGALPIPQSGTAFADIVAVWVGSSMSTITIETGMNRSSYKGYVTLRYTKTS